MRFNLAVGFLLLTCNGTAQIIGPAPKHFVLDGRVGEWRGRGDGEAPMRIARSGQGIVVAGSVKSIPLAAAHLELKLSLADAVKMPPVSWVGDEMLEDRCEDLEGLEARERKECTQWYRNQEMYREKLERLFVRVWQITPSKAQETYATPAFASMPEGERLEAAALRPSGSPIAKFAAGGTGGFTYEVLVPWSALPPADSLLMDHLQLAFRVMADGRTQDESARPSMRRFTIAPPIVARLTPCELQGSGVFLLGEGLLVKKALRLENGKPFYRMHRTPDAASWPSPKIPSTETFTQQIGPGEFLCSSPLTYRKGKVTRTSKFEIGAGPDYSPIEPAPATLPTKRTAEGNLLVRDGPSWLLAFQMHVNCIGSPWPRLAIYAITPSGDVKRALELMTQIQCGAEEPVDYDIEMSSDWRIVTEYTSDGEKWTTKRYCLTGTEYRPCGGLTDSRAPTKGLLLDPKNQPIHNVK